jgi:aspartate/methionine/tyrosine aminotransferase
MSAPRAAYMEWAKSRPRVRFDLAVSAVPACTVDDLPGAREALELSGPNDNGYAPLIEAIARTYDVSAAGVATAPGCSGANFLVFAALVGAGDEVLVERPAYDPLLAAPRLFGARVARFERPAERGFALDPAAVTAGLTPRTRLIVLTNPHNPSGALASDDVLREIGEAARRVGARVLVDEVYLDAAADRPRRPAATLGEVFISTSSLTKAYGLAGLRCGWVLAAPAIAEAVRRARDLVDATGAYPAERIAALAFDHLDRLRARARDLLARHLDRVRSFVCDRPELAWVEPGGGTVVFPRLREVDSSDALAAWLAAHEDTAIVPGRFFEAPPHFRLGLGVSPTILDGGLAALARALDAGRHGGSTGKNGDGPGAISGTDGVR